MLIETFSVGDLEVNCTVLACEDTKQAVVIDLGADVHKILEFVKKENLIVKYLLHTHAHFDHIGFASEFKKQGYGKILLHKNDLFLYEGMEDQAILFGVKVPPPDCVDHFIEDGEIISFGNCSLEVLHTPGHSPGGCCFILKDQNLVIVGDTLFRGSIGRTDFLGGDFQQLMNSIVNKLLRIEGDLKVITGHGPFTTLHREARTNPFLVGR